jgi:hypothetical protein
MDNHREFGIDVKVQKAPRPGDADKLTDAELEGVWDEVTAEFWAVLEHSPSSYSPSMAIGSAKTRRSSEMPHNGVRIVEDKEYGTEASLPMRSGIEFRTDAGDPGENTFGCDYVRVLSSDGREVDYWDSAEWAEDPQAVMGGNHGRSVRRRGLPHRPRT